MSALTNRIFYLRRAGVTSPQEIANIVGLTAEEVAARLKDPSLPDPENGTGLAGGGGGGNPNSFARAVIAIPGIGQNAANPGAISGEEDIEFSQENLDEWAIVDDIGLIADPPAVGTTHIGLPAGVYQASASILGISPSASHYGYADMPTEEQDRTRFKVFQIALEFGSLAALTNPGVPSIIANSVVMNGRMSMNFGGLTVGPILVDATQDMGALDPSYEGLFGWVRLDKWEVDRLDGSERVNTTDEHTFVGAALTIEKLA